MLPRASVAGPQICQNPPIIHKMSTKLAAAEVGHPDRPRLPGSSSATLLLPHISVSKVSFDLIGRVRRVCQNFEKALSFSVQLFFSEIVSSGKVC